MIMRPLCTSACQAKVSIVLAKSHPLAVARPLTSFLFGGATPARAKALGETSVVTQLTRARPSAPIAGVTCFLSRATL